MPGADGSPGLALPRLLDGLVGGGGAVDVGLVVRLAVKEVLTPTVGREKGLGRPSDATPDKTKDGLRAGLTLQNGRKVFYGPDTLAKTRLPAPVLVRTPVEEGASTAP